MKALVLADASTTLTDSGHDRMRSREAELTRAAWDSNRSHIARADAAVASMPLHKICSRAMEVQGPGASKGAHNSTAKVSAASVWATCAAPGDSPYKRGNKTRDHAATATDGSPPTYRQGKGLLPNTAHTHTHPPEPSASAYPRAGANTGRAGRRLRTWVGEPVPNRRGVGENATRHRGKTRRPTCTRRARSSHRFPHLDARPRGRPKRVTGPRMASKGHVNAQRGKARDRARTTMPKPGWYTNGLGMPLWPLLGRSLARDRAHAATPRPDCNHTSRRDLRPGCHRTNRRDRT